MTTVTAQDTAGWQAKVAARLTRPPEVLYTDLDGTLLGPGGALLRAPDGSPSARAAAALADAAAAGLLVVPVSGRQRHQLVQDCRLLGLADCIAEAGSVTVTGGQVAYAWGACPAGLADTPTGALEASGAITLLLEHFAGDLRRYEPWWRGREGGMLLHGQVDVAAANALLAAEGIDWAHLRDNGATGGWPGRQVRAYHLLPHGVGKAPAVAADLTRRGIDPAAAASIGDSPEDATMSRAVGCAFAVANASGVTPSTMRTPGAMGEGFADAVAALLAVRAAAPHPPARRTSD